MSETNIKLHNDTEFQFYERKNGDSLKMSFSAIRQSKWDELKATMFYLDSNDFEKCRLQKNECCASLNGFVENINPEKRIYMRQLPILVSMADKEPRFLSEEVLEIASLLLRRSSKSEELPEKLKMYPGTMWACGPKETLPEVITLTEVKQLFEDADIDKRLVTITPDVEFSSLIDMCRIGACQNLYFTDYRGKSSVYRALAIHKIFCECVLGLNWATNTCKQHLNCKENCRRRVIEVMTKYLSEEEASSMDLIPMETVQMEIAKLKREECYFKEQRGVNLQFNYLFQGLSNDKIISLDLYNTMTDYFQIPKNEALSELNSAPVQGMRLSCLLGWIVQFIGVIDEDVESQCVSLAHVLVSNLEFLIEKDVEKTIEFMRNEMVFDRKGLTVRAFMSDETQDKTQSKYDRMAEKAKLRKQAVQQKKNKKGGKQKLEKEKAENDYSETELKDLFHETMTLLASESGSETCLKFVKINGHSYGSNYDLMKNGPRNFFLINLDIWDKLVNMRSMMGSEWLQDGKCLEDLESFVELTGTKKFVIRCFQEGDLERYVLREEALEIMRISQKLRGAEREIFDILEESRIRSHDHVYYPLTFEKFEQMIITLGIDKSIITVIPDFVGRINETNAKKNVYSPITTIGRKGEFLLKLRESALYIFNNVICGVDWKTAIRENGIADYLNFRKTFEDTLKPLFCEWETNHLDKNWHDETITNLRNHKIFENQCRSDLNFFEDFVEDSLVPTAHFKEQCEAFNLPPMPHLGSLPGAMLVVEAKVLILVVWTCQFYPRLDAPKEQGDSAMQREVIRNAMFLRMPMESKFRKQFTNLIAYWSETRASVRRTMTLEPTEPARKPSQLELEEEASRNLIRAVVLEKKKQKKEKRNANGAEVSVATAKREDDAKDVESSRESSGKSSKSLKVQEEATKKMEKGQEPNKDGKGGAQLLKKLDNISRSSANPNGLSKKSEKLPNPGYEGPRSSATNESSRSSSTSDSEPCSSQKSLSKDEIPVKKQNLMIELMEYVKQLCEENETLKSKIEERREEDSNKLRKAKKELGKEEKTDQLEPNWKSRVEIMEKNLIEAEKQRDVANQKLRKTEEKLRKEIGFNVEMGYQLRGEKKDLEIMIREKELALEETVKEWTERWNVERYQVEQAQKKTAKLEQDWKLSFEFMEKNQIEAEEQRDVANEKLRKTEEELREQIAISRNLEQQLKEANMALTAMNKEKDRAVEAKERAVVREWTERWNVERYQVELAQKKITEVESKARQLLREKEKLLEKQSENLHLQNRAQELSNQPGPSSQQVSEDFNVYLEKIQKMLANLNRDDSIEEKRIRISRLLTGTDSEETRRICVLEEDLFDASVTMYRNILNFNKYNVQQNQCTAECQTIPIYPDLSKRFLNLEKKEKGKAMFDEGECAVCFEKMEDYEETRTCPHEKCSLVYHAKCIQKSVENKAVCPYCQKPYCDVQDFPALA